MLPKSDEARHLVETLGLEEHPEGGWYRRWWTAPDAESASETGSRSEQQRGAGSSIQYLLEGKEAARWHRIDASEIWVHSAGSPVVLSQWSDSTHSAASSIVEMTLGGRDLATGEGGDGDLLFQAVVEPDVWQSARCAGDWALVICVVVPEFQFENFEMAPDGWSPPR